MTYRRHLGCILPKVPAISLDVVDRAPDINRDSKGQCLPVFDTPSMGYMDKTIFWRNRVMGGAGVKLEPCRADCLNVSAAALVRLLSCLKEAGRTDVDRVRVRQR